MQQGAPVNPSAQSNPMTLNFSDNYYQLFALPKAMFVDHELLDLRYKNLQRELHPDNYANGSDAEKRWSMQATSLLNQARRVLLDPLSRAIYLLSLEGVDLNAETDTRMSGEFLMLQMELREELETIAHSAEPFELIDKLRAQALQYTKALYEAFEQAYSDGLWQVARERVREWQFLSKLIFEINEIESQLDDN
jgi:molecular chaperone HscB